MPLTHPYSRRYSSKYFSKYLAIFFLLFFSFFSLSLNTSWKSCRRELSLSEIDSYNCISSSTFYIPRIDKSLGDHKTHVPPYIPLPSVSSNKKLEEIFGPWSWNAAICLSASPSPSSSYEYTTDPQEGCGEEGNTRNEDDRIRRGFQSRTEIEGPRIEKPRRFVSTRLHFCVLRKTRKEGRGKMHRKILPLDNSVLYYLYVNNGRRLLGNLYLFGNNV